VTISPTCSPAGPCRLSAGCEQHQARSPGWTARSRPRSMPICSRGFRSIADRATISNPQTLTVMAASQARPVRRRSAAGGDRAVVQTPRLGRSHTPRPASRATGDDACVRVPGPLCLATFDRLAAASDLLWDDTGKPRPLEVEITPRPFTLASGGGPLPELVRLTVEPDHRVLLQPAAQAQHARPHWTRDQTASLSVQVKQDASPLAHAACRGCQRQSVELLPPAPAGRSHGSTCTWHVRLGPSQLLA